MFKYTTYKKDDVVGIIKQKKGDQYVVDIGPRDRVTLSKYAFEGATKKYKPDLKVHFRKKLHFFVL